MKAHKFALKVIKRFNGKLYHKDTSFLLNYLTLNVKDQKIREEIDKERTIMMDSVYWFFTFLTLVGFILNLLNFLISKQAESIVVISLGVYSFFFVM